MTDAVGSNTGVYEDWPESRQSGPLNDNSDNYSEQYSDYDSIAPYGQVGAVRGTPIPALNTAVFTTELWVDVLGRSDSTRYIVDNVNWLGGLADEGYLIQANASNDWEFDVGTGSAQTAVVGSAVTSGWHLLDTVYNGTAASLYVDGLLAASVTTAYTPNSGPLGPLYLGGGERGMATLCDCDLSQVAYYDVALTLSAVAGHYTLGTTGGARWWQPTSSYLPWQWEIDHALDTSSTSDMGTGIVAWNGDTSPADNPKVHDIDGILNNASTVSTLHSDGDKVVCYIEVGSAGNYYTAEQEGISTTYYAQPAADGDLGAQLPGYPGYYLDIPNQSTVGIIESMIAQQCAAKGSMRSRPTLTRNTVRQATSVSPRRTRKPT